MNISPRGIRRVRGPGLLPARSKRARAAACLPQVCSWVELHVVSQTDVEQFHGCGVFTESVVTHPPQSASCTGVPRNVRLHKPIVLIRGIAGQGGDWDPTSTLEVPKAKVG